jgi:signal transduction histidine kinase
MFTCLRVYTGKCPKEVEILPPKFRSNVPLMIRSDRSRMCQIVGNLLSNSSKFTVSGSLQILVSVEENVKPQLNNDCDAYLLITVQVFCF